MLYALFMMLSSCGFSQKIESFELAKNFYQNAKEKENEIKLFHNIYAEARGIDPVDSTYRITRIDLRVNDNTTLIIPGIKEYMKEKQIEELPFYENIAEFGKLNNLTSRQAQDSIRTLSIKVIRLMNELKAYKVVGNPQGNGCFIIFSITSDYDVIYVSDTSSVKHRYWKTFFASGNKFDDNWYYRKN